MCSHFGVSATLLSNRPFAIRSWYSTFHRTLSAIVLRFHMLESAHAAHAMLASPAARSMVSIFFLPFSLILDIPSHELRMYCTETHKTPELHTHTHKSSSLGLVFLLNLHGATTPNSPTGDLRYVHNYGAMNLVDVLGLGIVCKLDVLRLLRLEGLSGLVLPG